MCAVHHWTIWLVSAVEVELFACMQHQHQRPRKLFLPHQRDKVTRNQNLIRIWDRRTWMLKYLLILSFSGHEWFSSTEITWYQDWLAIWSTVYQNVSNCPESLNKICIRIQYKLDVTFAYSNLLLFSSLFWFYSISSRNYLSWSKYLIIDRIQM